MNEHEEEVNMGSTVWQSQQVEAPRVSLEFVRHKVSRLSQCQSKERWITYILGVAVVGLNATLAVRRLTQGSVSAMDVMFGIFVLLFFVGFVGVAIRLRNYKRQAPMTNDSDVVGGLATYRSELERMTKMARESWRNLLWFAPCYLTLLVGGLIFDHRPGKLSRYVVLLLVGALTTLFANWDGRRKSRCLQRELDAVNSLK